MSSETVHLNRPFPELVQSLAEIVGVRYALTNEGAQQPYLREWRGRYQGVTPLVLLPGSTGEVSRILAAANSARVGVVPQSGNTGLVGGQIPASDGSQIVVCLNRLNRIRSVDPDTATMTCEAGVTLVAARDAADHVGQLFPLSLPSEGTCCIGGNLATNAGGANVLAYGMARQLTLGIEAVLADGRVWNGLSTLRKDNTGYDLKDLVIGSEGTLALITAATLKLLPRPTSKAVAFAGLMSLDAVKGLFALATASYGPALTGFEFMSARTLEFVVSHTPGSRSPLQQAYPWYVFLEVSNHGHSEDGATRALELLLSHAIEQGHVQDATVAQSLAQAQAIWRLRESASEAQKGEGGSIKHDISVPVGRIPDFIVRADAAVEKVCPGARPVAFGHFGDGNVHYNVSQPTGMEKDQYLAMWETMSDAVHEIVHALGGSISAEHGIGAMKRDALKHVKSDVELDMMRRIKQALDPNGILNPGKLL